VNSELEKTFAEMEKSLRIEGDIPVTKLPEQGWSDQQVLDTMGKLQQAESGNWKDGKLSGVIYHGGDKHVDLMNQVYSLFTLSNPLHPDVFPSIRKFEAEIIAMTAVMLGNVPGVCGAVTSGGTESILMACKAHRDYYAKLGITQPEM
jgi:sphinganine-1-phosphate aldolase